MVPNAIPPFIRQLVFWCFIHFFMASCLGAAVRESNMTLWLRFDENGTSAATLLVRVILARCSDG